jgi:hypothetical protein
MAGWKTWLLRVLALFALAVPAVRADNDQEVVIGTVVLGQYRFRHGETGFDGKLEISGLGSGFDLGYVEWYPLDRLGVGVRLLNFTQTGSGGCSPAERNVRDTMLTLQVLPYVSESQYWRLGTLVGAGPIHYHIGSDSYRFSASGTAVLGQGFIDWGGEEGGARFGVATLSARMDGGTESGVRPKRHSDNPSGEYVFLDLRWAFK